jgi:hypothetical protein
MIKIGQLQAGDIVMVNDEGQMREGVVVNKDIAENLIKVDNGIQEFWYQPQDLYPVVLDDAQLLKLGFEKEQIDGAIKYKKGAFRLVTDHPSSFSKIEMWYREDRRNFNNPISVHELQNLHLQMTKVPLERA